MSERLKYQTDIVPAKLVVIGTLRYIFRRLLAFREYDTDGQFKGEDNDSTSHGVRSWRVLVQLISAIHRLCLHCVWGWAYVMTVYVLSVCSYAIDLRYIQRFNYRSKFRTNNRRAPFNHIA